MSKTNFTATFCRAVLALATICTAAFAANPVPFIDLPLVPSSAKPGGAQFTLTVNGAGFVSGSIVNWNGSARSTTFVSPTQVTATILPTDIAKNGTASITVANPSPGGGNSNVAFFPIGSEVATVALGVRSTPGSPMLQADFNGDGKLDELIAGSRPDTISVLLGNGDATFHPVANYSVAVFGAAAGDLNGDGKPDLALTDVVGNDVQILLGNGDGTFSITGTFETGPAPTKIGTGDFDGDGNLDLAILSTNSGTGSAVVSILLGNGDGTFRQHVDYSVGSNPASLAVGDFNNDGFVDVVAANNRDQTISVLLGNGDGSFQSPVNSNAGSAPDGDMVVADFNSDGVLDLAVPLNDTVNGGSLVGVLLGNGDGSFTLQNTYSVPSCTAVAVGDFANRGVLDLAANGVLTTFGQAVYLLMGNGNGTFQTAVAYNSVASGPGIFVGDLNGDGRLDVFNGSVIVQTPHAGAFAPASLTFTETVGFTSRAKQVKFSNSGELPMKISSISTMAPFAQTNHCPGVLDVSGSCAVNVTFSPTIAGQQQGTVTVSANGLTPPPTLTVTGTGLAILVSPTSLAFGNQPVGISSQPQQVTLTNQTATSVGIQSINILGANHKDFSQTNNCGSTLGSKASCTINVVFTPSALGGRSAYVSIVDGNGVRYNVALTGTGT